MRAFLSAILITTVSWSSIAQTPSHHFFPDFYLNSAFHADQIPLSNAKKTALSDLVIEATVEEVRTLKQNGRIISELTIESPRGQLFLIEIQGGVLNDVGSFRTGEMYLNQGAKGTFYLRSLGGGRWAPACEAQSFVPCRMHETAWMGWQRSEVTLNTNWSAGNANQFVTLTGVGFGEAQGSGYVTFDNGGNYYEEPSAGAFHYSEWTDNSITVEVPPAFSNRVRVVTDDGTMMETTDSLHIGYNLSTAPGSSYGHTYLHNESDGGHLFHVNEEIFNIPERMDAVERTLKDFVCKTGVNLRLAESATSSGWDLDDGQNTISYDSPENPLSPGTAGYCYTLWYSCILGGETFFYVGEIDVVLNGSFDYDYSTGPVGAGQAKFAYVLMHELGHAMRLGHVNEWGETMYSSVTDFPSNEWSERDTISTNDRLGVSLAVERASSFTFDGCGVSNMVPLDIDCESVTLTNTRKETGRWLPSPNPFSNQLWIPGFHGAGETTSIRIMNASGQIIEESRLSASGKLWNASGLSDGIYFIHCIGCTDQRAVRVIKSDDL